MRTPFLIVSLSLLTVAVAAGQETQTERSAAASVISRMNALEGSYHTFKMETDALGEVGHRAFTIDAQAMAGVLYAYATDARYRATVTREFTGLQGLYADYLAALRTAYPLPTVPDATDR